MPLDPTVLALAGSAVLVGSLVQGAVGFGLGLVAAPLLALLEPTLVPGSLLLVTAPLPLLVLLREHRHIDWSGAGWALLGRLPATAAGVSLVAVVGTRGVSVVVAVVVLAALAVSLVSLRVAPTAPALVLAGAVSGVTGTATSIGGPPVALLYQREPGPTVRATLSVFFFVGTSVSVAALASAGRVGEQELVRAALLLPFLTLGFAVSGRLRPLLDRGWTRPAVLGLAGASATALLVRSLGG